MKALNHWGWVTHICVSKLTIIGSDNGLLPSQHHAIIRTNAVILLIGPLGTNLCAILIKIHIFSFKKRHLKMSSGKWQAILSPLQCVIVRRAGLLWSQQDFEWRWSVPLFKGLTVLEFSFILLDLCLLITFFNFIMNYVPIVAFWIFTYHKIWILSIMFCFIWSYWIIYFLACLEVSWRVVS